jgi:hypothetical protein
LFLSSFLSLTVASVAMARPGVPPNSVGSRELQRHSVTAKKLARGAVTRSALAPELAAALDAAGVPGPVGPAGPQGAPGAVGPAGPGAAAIRFFAQASDSPTPQTALDFQGLKISATCQKSGTQTRMGFQFVSTEAAVIHDHFNVDFGTDPQSPGSVQTGTLQFELQPGVEVSAAPPPVDSPNFGRVFATLIYETSARIMQLNLVVLVNGADETCRLAGVATPAS